jgi:cell division FtsZ-interacting protein ZapD
MEVAMAAMTRAEELVQTMERDRAFQQDVEAAPTVTAKRDILDAHGFQDVSLDDMKAYVESQGATLVVRQGDRELSDEELDAVVGGLTDAEQTAIDFGIVGGIGVAAAVAASGTA